VIVGRAFDYDRAAKSHSSMRVVAEPW
jgi:hypothetical protein